MECTATALGSDLEAVYYASIAVFGLALLVVFGMYLFDRYQYQNVTMTMNIAMFIFSLQVLLYGIFLSRLGSSFIDDLGSCQPYARWAIYTVSCALLAYEISGLAGMPSSEALGYILMISVTLSTGALAAFAENLSERWILFAIGFVPYMISFAILYRYSRWPLLLFVLITWSLYPLFLLLGPLFLDVISLPVESGLYLGADLITKVGFEFYVIYMERCHCQQQQYKTGSHTE